MGLTWKYDPYVPVHTEATGRFVLRYDIWSTNPDAWAVYDMQTSLYYSCESVNDAKACAQRIADGGISTSASSRPRTGLANQIREYLGANGPSRACDIASALGVTSKRIGAALRTASRVRQTADRKWQLAE